MKNKIILIIVVIFLIIKPSQSQNFWEESGFNYGGQVYSLIIIKNGDIFAGHSNGIYKSTDGGINWNRVYETSVATISLAYDSTNDYIFAGLETSSGQYGGIYRSTNQGASWGDYDLANKKITDIIVTTDGTVFACSPTDYPNGGVFESTDNGINWVNSLGPIYHTFCLALDLSDNIYAGTDDPDASGKPTIMKSTDNGATWDTLYKFVGFSTYVRGLHITKLGTMFAHFSDKLFRSSDNGSNWVQVLSGVEHYDIIKMVSDSLILVSSYGPPGVYSSEDDGINWNPSNSGLTNTNVIPLVLDTILYVYVGANSRIFKSTFPIPVELTSFDVITNGNTVTLNWATATEINNLGFEIERKAIDEDFVTVGFVEGNGTTTMEQSYLYTDKNIAPGKYFYRLKQLDYNGSYEFSNIVDVEVIDPDKFELYQNYPNPFNPSTIITYSVPQTQIVSLKIYDVLGNEITTLLNEEKPVGYYEINFDAINLSSGVYFYRMQAGGFVSTRKFILMK